MLTNLAYVPEDFDMQIILASQLNYDEEGIDEVLHDIANDFQYNKSVILEKMNHIMKAIVADGYKDIKTMNLILLFLTNCIGSGIEFTDKVKRETCILEVIRDLARQK